MSIIKTINHIIVKCILLLLLLSTPGLSAKPVHKISPEYLARTSFSGPDFFALRFPENNKFNLSQDVEGSTINVSGSYQIKANQASIVLTVKKDQNKEFANYTGAKKFTCFLYDSTKYLQFKYELQCHPKKWIFYDKTAKRSTSKRLKIDNIDLVTMNQKARVNDAVRVRSKPSLKGKKLEYCVLSDAKKLTCKKSIPKGVQVKVLARTASKMKIQKWHNYWYYIEYDKPYYIDYAESYATAKSNAWAFGEFLDVAPRKNVKIVSGCYQFTKDNFPENFTSGCVEMFKNGCKNNSEYLKLKKDGKAEVFMEETNLEAKTWYKNSNNIIVTGTDKEPPCGYICQGEKDDQCFQKCKSDRLKNYGSIDGPTYNIQWILGIKDKHKIYVETIKDKRQIDSPLQDDLWQCMQPLK